MFEEDLSVVPTADLLEAGAGYRALAQRADTRVLEAALVYADRYHPSAQPDRLGRGGGSERRGRRSGDGRERAVVLGGDGCPEIVEFAIAEFGVLLGVSPGVAAGCIGNALALRHRFPFTWARVLAGEATPWKACRIVADCSKLSEEAAAYVDKRVAVIVDSITPYRLDQIVQAAKRHADPAAARAAAAEKARERGVFVGQADEHGTKTMYIKAAAGAVARNDAKLAAIADALAVLGDTRPVQARRAEAVGIMPDSLFTEELLAQARAHRLTHPTTPDAPDSTGTRQTSGTPGASEAAATDPAAGLADASGTADATGVAGRFGPDPAAPDPAAPDRGAGSGLRSEPCWGDEDLLRDWLRGCAEAGADAAAGHGAPHPSVTDLPDPFDVPPTVPVEPLDPRDPCGPGVGDDAGDDESMDAAARRALYARLAQIKHDAHTQPTSGVRVGPGRTEIYVHLTDHTLATGTGVLRVEGLGPMIADQLTELVGHGPYLVKPVIDLNDAVSVNAYEIPEKIRERVKLTHPVELFPYGTRETTRSIDLDHIQPYDPLGPPGQTATTNLAPLGRLGHRVKTHAAGWTVCRVDYKTLEWTTPHGFRFHVDPTGTHRIHPPHGEPDTN